MTKRVSLSVSVAILSATFLISLKAETISRAQRKTVTEQKTLIGPIKEESPFGCGCEFTFPSESRKRSPRRLVFSSDIDEETAVMNIDGLDIELRLLRATEAKGKERIGSRSTRTYAGDGISVFAVYVTTRMCKPNDENCEATDYDATVTATKGERKQTIKLKGACGC